MHIQYLIATKKTEYEKDFYSGFQLWQHLALDFADPSYSSFS